MQGSPEDHFKALLSPWVALPLAYLTFLLLAALSYAIPETGVFLFQPRGYFPRAPKLLSYAVTILGVIVLAIFSILGRRVSLKDYTNHLLVMIFVLDSITLALTIALPLPLLFVIALGYIILLLFISRDLGKPEKFLWISVSVALLAFFSIIIKGIPILDVGVRQGTAVAIPRGLFHGFAVFSAVVLMVFYRRKVALPATFLLALLAIISGFKSDAIAVLVSAAIAGILTEKISMKEIGAVAAATLLIMTAVSTHIAGISYARWGISPLVYAPYRAGFTFLVFDRIVEMGFPFGYTHGGAVLSTTMEIVSTRVLEYSTPHIITSTLIGPGMLDFGMVGVLITCALIGLYLGSMHNYNNPLQKCLYAMALTHTLILIEVGFQLTSGVYYLTMAYLAAKTEA